MDIEDQQSRFAIHAACREGQINVVVSLLNANSSLHKSRDDDDRLPLHWAVCANNLEIVEYLSERASFDVDAQDGAGWTPLMMASSIPDGDKIVDLLLARHADVALCTNNGQTALHFAASKSASETVRKLLSHGASVVVKDKRAQRPLHRAAAVGCEAVVKMLLEKQGAASINVADSDGLTALHHAIAEGHGETAMILLRAGARLKKRDDEQDPLTYMNPDPMVVEYINRKSEEEGITVSEP